VTTYLSLEELLSLAVDTPMTSNFSIALRAA
jgi:hypothetical protein